MHENSRLAVWRAGCFAQACRSTSGQIVGLVSSGGIGAPSGTGAVVGGIVGSSVSGAVGGTVSGIAESMSSAPLSIMSLVIVSFGVTMLLAMSFCTEIGRAHV